MADQIHRVQGPAPRGEASPLPERLQGWPLRSGECKAISDFPMFLLFVVKTPQQKWHICSWKCVRVCVCEDMSISPMGRAVQLVQGFLFLSRRHKLVFITRTRRLSSLCSQRHLGCAIRALVCVCAVHQEEDVLSVMQSHQSSFHHRFPSKFRSLLTLVCEN